MNQASSDFLGGHIWFKFKEKLNPKFYYCTVLRDPTHRFLSQFRNNRRMFEFHKKNKNLDAPDLADSQVIYSVKFALDDFLSPSNYEICGRFYSNIQSRHFAARTSSNIFISDKELLDAAIASLEEYDLVGNMEELVCFLNTIKFYFGIDQHIDIPFLNAAEDNPRNISDFARKRLDETNWVDNNLILWAKEHFQLDKEKGILIKNYLKSSKNSYPTLKSMKDAVKDSRRSIQIIESSVRVELENNFIIISAEIEIVDPKIIPLEDVTLGFAIYDESANFIYGTNSNIADIKLFIKSYNNYRAVIRFENFLIIDHFYLTLALHKGLSHEEGSFHWLECQTLFKLPKKCEGELQPSATSIEFALLET
jgi:hypothetical protein